MKFLLRLFVFGLIFLPNLVLAGDISDIYFTNDPQSIKPNEASCLTIRLEYSGDSHPTACMLMFSDSNTGQFSSNDTTWSSVDKLTINSNWSNKNFYYKDKEEGNYILTVKVVPVSCSVFSDEEAQWTANQNIVVSDQEISSPTPQPSPEATVGAAIPTSLPDSGSGWPEYVPPEERPRIKAYGGDDKVAVVGALTEFRGVAYNYSDEPLEGNVRYLWNFGDGTTKEGKNIYHYYSYPGEYRTVLNVSLLKETASDYLIVKVIPGEVYISEIKYGTDGFIKLENRSNYEINISDWMLRYGNQGFSFPHNSFIRPDSFLTISSVVSGIVLSHNITEVELLYSTGMTADTFSSSQVQRTYEVAQIEMPNTTTSEVQMISEVVKIDAQELEKNKEPEKIIKETPAVEDTQKAGVITVGDTNSGRNTGVYVFIVFSMAVLSGLGLFVVRRNSRV